ncbi:heavy metal translocating P-type ATPase [Caldithrix abyssi DSM 13497]|uniref:P-type Cu(2+) transporter n=1 Tax=Caldithrix abyssi DSM 13497 TaxID=880073 RepID=H1XX88_CALAY|nr:heavy metal translocating P-type ATPase [Caldithrix abyssi]APF20674.1 Cu+-exporting ATPase [Caldithrix abyssi DSM 13497]EHO40825.1 heavy metal translocating P-type ATPase [Caldithrix abyssi DSM 13497]
MEKENKAKFYTFVPIEGMTCAACVTRVEKGLRQAPHVATVNVNLAAEQAALGLDSDQVNTQEILEYVQKSGYDVKRAKITIPLAGLQDTAMALKVEEAIRPLLGVVNFNVNTVEEAGLLEYVPGMLDLEEVARRLKAFGFAVDLKSGSRTVDEMALGDKVLYLKKLKLKVILGAALSALVFVLTMPMLFPFVQSVPLQVRLYVAFVLTSVVLFYSGRQFFTGFLKALKAKTADMNSLVAIGAGMAYLYSTVVTFLPSLAGRQLDGYHIYFDTAAMITSFILFGRYLEGRAKTQTTSALKSLMELKPRTAFVQKDGRWEEVSAEQIKKGDVCLVKTGGSIPADGVLLEDRATINESMLTGESLPVNKKRGDLVIGGTINLEHPVKIQVLKTGEETVLGQILQLIKEAQGSKPQIQKLADRVAAVFVPLVLMAAALIFILWMLSGAGLVQSMLYFIAVVVVACPCALGLATPTAIMVATGRGAQEGILIKNADIIQNLVKINYLFFDKTGTLTSGQMTVQKIIAFNSDEETLLRFAAALEEQANHPIGQAIVRKASEKNLKWPPVKKVRTRQGLGVQGEMEGQKVLVGSLRLMEREAVEVPESAREAFSRLSEEALTPVFVAVNEKVMGGIAVADQLKQNSAQVVDYFKREQIEPAVVSGDNQKTTQKIAEKAGIQLVHAEVSPTRKAKLIKEYQVRGHKIGMVGDGINDAIALTQADVGIAMGHGTDVAMDAADVVLMGQNLLNLKKAHQLSKITLKIMKQNFFWAFGYNVMMIPAAAGLLQLTVGITFHPAAAALAMAFSSVSVVSNSLRLKRVKLDE